MTIVWFIFVLKLLLLSEISHAGFNTDLMLKGAFLLPL